jgi:hypothetical protein
MGRTDYAVWCSLLARAPDWSLQPIQREADLPDWCSTELIATEGARARLSRWVRAGEPIPELLDLCFVGDRATEGAVRSTLGRLPAPVQWYTVRTAAIVGLSPGAGRCAFAPPWPLHTDEAARLLLVSAGPDAVCAVLAHEVAHLWLLPAVPASEPRLSAAERRFDEHRFASLAQDWGLLSHAADKRETAERQAIALANDWGFALDSADEEYTCRHARSRVFEAVAP